MHRGPVILVHLGSPGEPNRTACSGDLWDPPEADEWPDVPRQMCAACISPVALAREVLRSSVRFLDTASGEEVDAGDLQTGREYQVTRTVEVGEVRSSWAGG